MPVQIQPVPAYSVGSSCVQNASQALLNEVVDAHTFDHLLSYILNQCLELSCPGYQCSER